MNGDFRAGEGKFLEQNQMDCTHAGMRGDRRDARIKPVPSATAESGGGFGRATPCSRFAMHVLRRRAGTIPA